MDKKKKENTPGKVVFRDSKAVLYRPFDELPHQKNELREKENSLPEIPWHQNDEVYFTDDILSRSW